MKYKKSIIILLSTILALLLTPFSTSLVHAAKSSLPLQPSLSIMAGQMIMVGFRGTGATPHAPEFRNVLQAVREGKIGGVIFFDRDWTTKKSGRNVVTTEQVKRMVAVLQKNAAIPLFIAVDQEGGKVQRLRPEHGFPHTISAAEMGKNSPRDSYLAGKIQGTALHKLGINVNFAPVTDVAANAESPAITKLERAFSADPKRVAEHASQFAEGLGASGIIACYKHFPGHGSARNDTHKGLTDITNTWSTAELYPYQKDQLPANIPLMIMTGHLVHRELDSTLPASLSHKITTDLLRKKMGWQGVVVTDDLQMQAITAHYSQEETIALVVQAGADIILFGNNLEHSATLASDVHSTVMRLIKQKKISAERVRESWLRIRKMKEQLR